MDQTVTAAIPAMSGFLDDARVEVTAAQLLYEVIISIFIVTVIPEELAFRGVLLSCGTSGVVRALARFADPEHNVAERPAGW